MREGVKPKPKRSIASKAQLAYLVDFMRDHPDLATHHNETGLQGRAALDRLWLQLSNQLNALWGPPKTVFKWKQAWRDIRNKVKKRAAQPQAEPRRSSGYGPPSVNNAIQSSTLQGVKPKPKRSIASKAQLAYLVDFMKNHPDLATHHNETGLQGRAALDRLWVQLSNQLNALWGPPKTVFKWKQAWRDIRNKVKRKSGQQSEAKDRNSRYNYLLNRLKVEQVPSVGEPSSEATDQPFCSLGSCAEDPLKPSQTSGETPPYLIPTTSDLMSTEPKRKISNQLEFDEKLLRIEEQKVKLKEEKNDIIRHIGEHRTAVLAHISEERTAVLARIGEEKVAAIKRLTDVLQELVK